IAKTRRPKAQIHLLIQPPLPATNVSFPTPTMRASISRHFRMSFLVLSFILFASSAFAAPKATIHVDVIVASHQGHGIQGSLNGYEQHLEAQFTQFSHFTVVRSQTLTLSKNTPIKVALPGDAHASFTLRDRDNRM